MNQLSKYVSLIVPCRNEVNYIPFIIKNILEQNYPKELIEVFIIDGLSDDGTVEYIQKFVHKYNFIKFLNNPYKVVPYALNIGIKNAKGDIIIRLDAHAEYPKNYISTLVNYLEKLNADNVGGVWETVPSVNTHKAKSIAIALSSPFGVGDATYRLASSDVEYIEVDTVPFVCYRRDVFDRIGLFDEQLTRNQDNEFNERLRKAGGKIYLIPSLKIKYYARENYSKLYKMFFQYGYFGPLVDLKLKKPTRLRRYIPTAFVLSLIMPLLLSLLFYPFLYLWVFTVSLYLIASVTFGTYECRKRDSVQLVPYVMWAYFVSHVSYGLGYLKGVFDFMILKKHLKSKLDVELSR